MNDQILEIFRQIAGENKEIRLFNVYKGVPISYAASVMEVGPSSIRVKTGKHQIVCLYNEKETYIQSNEFTDIIKVRVVEMDLARLEAVLSEFRYIKSGVGARTQVRVQPKDPIEGGVKTRDMYAAVRGELADISQGGLAIYISKKRFIPKIFSNGVRVNVTLRFPGEYEVKQYKTEDTSTPEDDPMYRFSRQGLRLFHLPELAKPASSSKQVIPSSHSVRFPELKIQCTIAYAIEERPYRRHRIGIQILPNDLSRSVIAQFISQRQSEIIREINAVFDLISQRDSR